MRPSRRSRWRCSAALQRPLLVLVPSRGGAVKGDVRARGQLDLVPVHGADRVRLVILCVRRTALKGNAPRTRGWALQNKVVRTRRLVRRHLRLKSLMIQELIDYFVTCPTLMRKLTRCWPHVQIAQIHSRSSKPVASVPATLARSSPATLPGPCGVLEPDPLGPYGPPAPGPYGEAPAPPPTPPPGP